MFNNSMKFLILGFFLLQVYSCSNRTVLSHIVYRHGERTPDYYFGWEGYNNTMWDSLGGLGQLTMEGKKQEYEIGKKIKDRYLGQNKLIDGKFKSESVYIRSSAAERCLMSAQLQAASTFEPTNDEVIQKKLNWQPVPIYSMPSWIDYLLRSATVECPKLEKYFDDVFDTEEMHILWAKLKPILDPINRYLPTKFNIKNIYQFEDVISAMERNNFEIPHWAQYGKAFPAWLRNYVSEQFKILFMQNSTEYRKLFGGALLNEIVTRLENFDEYERTGIITQDSYNPETGQPYNVKNKLILYSGHDITLAAITNALGIELTEKFPFGSIFTIDLVRDTDSNELFVDAYTNYADKEFTHVEMPFCPSPCKLSSFLSAYDDIRMADPVKECKTAYYVHLNLLMDKFYDYKVATFIILTLLVVASVGSGVLFFFYTRYKRQSIYYSDQLKSELESV